MAASRLKASVAAVLRNSISTSLVYGLFPLCGRLFDLDMGRFDQRPPLFDLRFLIGAERFRRLLLDRRDFLAEIEKPLPRRRIGERRAHRSGEFGDDRL